MVRLLFLFRLRKSVTNTVLSAYDINRTVSRSERDADKTYNRIFSFFDRNWNVDHDVCF